jgi:putative metallohydrolase (TIGR04338 family)
MTDSYLSVPEMQALINKWCSSKVLQRRYPRAARPPRVTDGRSRRRGGAYGRELRMPRSTRNKPYLLHELAHYLVPAAGRPAHGWEYAECYLYLVRVFLGKASEEALRREFKTGHVRYREPRRSTMTPEQRQLARERMLAWHAAKAVA